MSTDPGSDRTPTDPAGRTGRWHVDHALADAYAEGRAGAVLAASVEQHLVGCPACRSLLRPHADTARLDAVWAEVAERVQAPRRTVLERVLARLGVSDATARLVAATPALRGAWLAAVTLVLVVSLVGALADPRGVAAFLLLVPLLPVAGVALAFGPAGDPAHEVAAAAPYDQLRLLALRTAVVVTGTLVPAAVAGLLLPGPAMLAVVWLLPALALTTTTFALSTRVPPAVAATAAVAAWTVAASRGLLPGRDPLLTTHPSVQLVCAVLLAASVAALVAQRRDLAEILRRTA